MSQCTDLSSMTCQLFILGFRSREWHLADTIITVIETNATAPCLLEHPFTSHSHLTHPCSHNSEILAAYKLTSHQFGIQYRTVHVALHKISKYSHVVWTATFKRCVLICPWLRFCFTRRMLWRAYLSNSHVSIQDFSTEELPHQDGKAIRVHLSGQLPIFQNLDRHVRNGAIRLCWDMRAILC